jgi:predicted nicotinamide N-methyase
VPASQVPAPPPPVPNPAAPPSAAWEHATPRDAAGFIRAHTRLAAPPLVPELALWLSHDEPTSVWERLELANGRDDLPPPFWAYPWAGGIALARYLLDHRDEVAGRAVLDLGSGSGLVAIAAARAGAAAVTASDIDPMAVTAIGLNAAANDAAIIVATADLLAGAEFGHPDLVLVGDAFYERRMAHRVLSFLDRARAAGARVLIGDPGRTYLPPDLRALASYPVPAWAGLEDTEVKQTTVWERS